MRIGIDCRLWNETGIGRYTRNLVKELGKIDTKNEYILFFRKNEFNAVDLPGTNFYPKLADVRWHSIKEQLIFSKILYKEKLDLVHFPYFSMPVTYNKPFVITIHDLILNHYPTGKASTLPSPLYWVKQLGYQFVLAQAAERAKKVIAVSQATKSEILDHLSISEKKITVIYEGVDPLINGDGYLNIENEKFFFYIGNAYPHKNLQMLVDAFKDVLKENPSVSLVFVGKEDYFYIQLKEYIHKNGLDNSVLLYGYASDEELSQLYKKALALVYPSKMEGFGLPLLEAMHNKCLVLASDIPVFREIGSDAIVYFDQNNIEDMKNAMISVIEDRKKFSKKIDKGFLRAKEFSWKKMAKETLQVYNSSL